eukprot:TRINITY_DN23149_c0_g1_i2.p1 TRINITY_DN23149_c0_g1~~TRINITY_DN23149_c0_g1_i2.p1  ORF type:complete len:469 (-),score=112.55 TRINITY_DN23149_c0_g1_i2:11-1417(-)
MGQVYMSVRELRAILDRHKDMFIGNEYSLTGKNCNHFTESFCQAVLGKSIPKWINRLAKWGNAISGIIPTGGKQIEAEMDGMDGARSSQNATAQIVERWQSGSGRDRESCLSDEELLVSARVESIVLRVLGGAPEHDPKAFSQAMLAMCWPFSAIKLASVMLVSMDSLPTFCLSPQSFEQIGCLSQLALCTIAAAGEHLACLHLATAASRLYRKDSEGTNVELHQTLKHHPVWKDMFGWNGMFFDGLALKLEKLALTTSPLRQSASFHEIDEQELETKEVVFSELTQCVHLMTSFELPRESVSQFLNEIQGIMAMEPARMTMLHQLLEYRSPAKKHARPDGPDFELLKTMFVGADREGTGRLTAEDVMKLIRNLYESEGRCRSSKAVGREVELAFEQMGVLGGGTIGADQFVLMVAHGDFKFAWSKESLDNSCLLYTSDAADEEDSVDLGGRRYIEKKNKIDRRYSGR